MRPLMLIYFTFLIFASCSHKESKTLSNAEKEYSYDSEISQMSYQKFVQLYNEVPNSSKPNRNLSSEASLSELRSGQAFPAVTSAAVLKKLQKSGFSMPEVLRSSSNFDVSNAAFYKKSSIYNSFVKLTVEDVKRSIEIENQFRPDWGEVSLDVGAARKGFDTRWLTSKYSRYDLIGLINRMDRKIFNVGTCGEMRLIYRLAYTKDQLSSRLPMTVNVVYYLPAIQDGNCSSYLKEWTAPSDLSVDGFSDWLQTNGPLKKERISLKNLKSIETNFQAVRSASGVRNMLGGNAEYILRVFHLNSDGSLRRGYLENTPDIEKIKNDPKLKADFLKFLKLPENLYAIEQGTLNIPTPFLAQKISSFSPHGIARFENRLFDKIFTVKDFSAIDFSKNKNVKTPSAMLRRLDDFSCIGCHQNRTIAGFHLLGEDPAGTFSLNGIFAGGSGHFRAEMDRRSQYLNQWLLGQTPSESRSFSISPASERAQYGDFCGLPGQISFAHWKCAEGLTCQLLDGADGEQELGKCYPETRLSGDPCLKNFTTQNIHTLDKMVQPWEVLNCGPNDSSGYECRLPGGGFPNGMCTIVDCSKMLDKNREICGPIAGDGFSKCLEEEDMNFEQCQRKTKATSGRGRCNSKRTCRNDYICARTDEEDGACVPSYFLFQIRVDGHPSPE